MAPPGVSPQALSPISDQQSCMRAAHDSKSVTDSHEVQTVIELGNCLIEKGIDLLQPIAADKRELYEECERPAKASL